MVNAIPPVVVWDFYTLYLQKQFKIQTVLKIVFTSASAFHRMIMLFMSSFWYEACKLILNLQLLRQEYKGSIDGRLQAVKTAFWNQEGI